jgi:kynureninase
VAQTEFLFRLAQEFLYPLGFTAGSPRNPNERGSHLSFRHPEAYRICKALIDPTVGNTVVIPDFRDPDNIRFGITPLYTTFSELYLAVMEIKGIITEKLYQNYSQVREQVT